MEKLKEEFKYEKRGITLIALVVTIIVLLILAGVSIATLTGDNGILTRAQDAKEKTEEASDIEKIRLAISEAQIGENGYQELNMANFQEALNNQFEGRTVQLSDNGDGSFIINLDNDRKMFYTNSDGQIISNENMLAIGTAEELKAFRDDVNSGNSYEGWYVYLVNDIALDINEEWEPIGVYPTTSTGLTDISNKPFKGIFDGNQHEINGIYINTNDKVKGFFGFVDSAQIKNLGLGSDCNITGGNNLGGIVGSANDTKIYNCYNKSAINGISNTGGIVGTAINSYIYSSYNIGKIEISQSNAGGICGNSDNTSIDSCYNTGNILASNNSGGLCGQIINDNIENCYNIGNITIKVTNNIHVGPIIGYGIQVNLNNNYYLANCVNEELVLSEQGIKKEDDEIKKIYKDLGDLFKDDIDGINNGYPILQWQ